MASGSESEAHGLHTVGNKEVEVRSSDRGPTGETPLGSRVWGGVLVRSNPDKMRNSMNVYRSEPQLRGTGR